MYVALSPDGLPQSTMPTATRVSGMVLTDHQFAAPVIYGQPGSPSISLFAREVSAPDGGDRPYLLFLQGGPGNEAPRPLGKPGGWLRRALEEYRVLLLDQRGTGRSTPLGSLPNMTARQQADYLTHFRADSIVRDAEIIRSELGVDRWSVLGQSFGGFCVMTYLSLFPDSLREAFLTGGLAPIGRSTHEVYAKTFKRVLERCRRYYERYPHDRETMRELVARLDGERVLLPGGDPLSARRFRQLGAMLGAYDGAERLHYLLELPFDSPAFRFDVERGSTFGRNPLYAVIHESCYADGCATNWAAQQMLPDIYATHPDLFTGEHVFPWMFEEISALAPLRDAAELLAQTGWPRLYDPEALKRNTVPSASAVYLEDMYVESEFSLQTARQIKGMRVWATNEFEHDGLRVHGDHILDRLIDLARGDA